jgi:hypothetical protein
MEVAGMIFVRRGLPSVSVPVLSTTTISTFSIRSIAAASLPLHLVVAAVPRSSTLAIC